MHLPSFTLSAWRSGAEMTISSADWMGKNVVLFLYPKDMTRGCTLESQAFRDAYGQFQALGWEVYGLSKDSLRSHEKFCIQESLPYPLLSDPSSSLIAALGAWKEKSMYGRKYKGTERSTFCIVDGEVVQQWRNVSAPGHAEAVLEWCKASLV